MERRWLQYLRFWGTALEARFEMALGRWMANLAFTLLILVAGLMAMILATASLVSWIVGANSWALGFLVGMLVWVGSMLGVGLILRKLLRRALVPKDAIYRLELAQAGMRLIEREMIPVRLPQWTEWVVPILKRWAISLVMRWLRRWLPFL
ncbi:MAG: hypothetical protein NZ580_05495 [Bacteroidia bacterium]|nr:hypothetical protein [Bacteroidia bacterium]MDW8236330.1 hypothetical protein [Bacteroidia bacterium]